MATATTTTHNPLGQTIPPDTPHAISVSLPTWSANVGYEEGQDWVLSKMQTGYPRFFVHKSIDRFASAIVERFGHQDEKAILFPTRAIATRCLDFFHRQAPLLKPHQVRILDLVHIPRNVPADGVRRVSPRVSAVLFPKENFSIAKTFWQHSGDGVSSRRAEFCHKALDEGNLVEKGRAEDFQRTCKGPKRYQHRGASIDGTNAAHIPNGHKEMTPITNGASEVQEHAQFVEERFGRNLEISFADNAKLAIRRRIAGSLTVDGDLKEALEQPKDKERMRDVPGFSEDDVYIYPTGMSSIFNTHRTMMIARGPMKSISYGFPYIDTLKILEKFGPGCQFYGHGSAEELDDLERRLASGERYLALFCEFPGNPLLITPDLQRIRNLADKYDFAVVVDETIGTLLNVHVLPHADVVVSSLSKIFSGESNVMGGSAVLNPKSRYYQLLKQTLAVEYEDNHWVEDSVFLERNSRDFVSRIDRINANAEAVCEVLMAHPRVKHVYYPKHSPTRHFYDHCRTPKGGYGGLLSATFYSVAEAAAFYDNLDTEKGPSLGTNFTLSSPYVLLAHYTELPWAASYGVPAELVRFSVGLENTEELVATFRRALAAIPTS
ncbi:cystathionine gamma-synthase-like protein [Cryomyces antarcticus]